MTFELTDRAVLGLSGPDAREFLQGLVTQDVRKVEAASPSYAALLTPQGKILFDFLMYEQDGTLLLDCAGAAARAARQAALALPAAGKGRDRPARRSRHRLVRGWDVTGLAARSASCFARLSRDHAARRL